MMTMTEEQSPPRKTNSRHHFFRRNKKEAKEGAVVAIAAPLPHSGSSAPSLLSLGKGVLLEDGIVHLTARHSDSYASTTATSTITNSSTSGSLHALDTGAAAATGWSNDSINATCALWKADATKRDLLMELGRRVSDIQYYKNTPDEVIRFLHAKSDNVKAAEHMFRTSVEWRRTVQADEALNRSPPQGLIDAIPGAILVGTDHDGDPIFVSRVGTFDSIGAFKRFGREEIVHHCIWIRELVGRGTWRAEREQAMGRPMKQVLIIEDLKGIPLSKLIGSPQILSLYGEMMRIDQENYPDASKKIIVIRTPALFRMAWNLVKPFFDKYVVEKMVFCGFHDYEEVLSQYVDLNVLPPDLLPGIGQGQAEVGMPQRFDGGCIAAAVTVSR